MQGDVPSFLDELPGQVRGSIALLLELVVSFAVILPYSTVKHKFIVNDGSACNMCSNHRLEGGIEDDFLCL